MVKIPRIAKLLLLLCIVPAALHSFSAAAVPVPGLQQQQSLTVSGKVKDKNGNPLPGVTVLVKDTKKGATTDEKGSYQIRDVSKSAVLVFQFIGFERQEAAVSANGTVNVVLKENEQTLQEYVAVGYGVQKKVTKTGSVASIKGTELKQSPNVNVSNSLVGRVPGLIAMNQSGEPGNDGSRILIRGRSTTGNTNPLVVIDGFPRDGLERLNPNDIESISVLKDAAAAIYGSRAANGVILVTTKRGKSGKPTLSYGFNQGFVQPTRLPKMADGPTYARIVNEINEYSGDKPKFTPEDIRKFEDGSDPWRHPNTNWYKAVIKDVALQNRHDLSISGGTEKMTYFVSLGTLFQDGIYKSSATNYKQHDVRANLDAVITDNIRIRVDLAGRMEDRNFPPRSAGSIFRALMRGRPTENAIWPNGLPGPDIEYGDNPVVTSTNKIGYDRQRRYVVNSALVAVINIPKVPGLFVDGSMAIDQAFTFQKRFTKPWTLYTLGDGVDANGQPVLNAAQRGVSAPELYESYDQLQNITLNAKLNYVKSFDKHFVSAFVAVEQAEMKGDNFNGQRRYFVSDKIDQLFAGADKEKNIDGGGQVFARRNFFGRVSYNYNETYLFDFNWRVDGSQNFPSNGRYGFFPGVSAGWVLSNERFWKERIKGLNYFKLRGSFGQLGNDQVPSFQYLSAYGFRSGGVVFGTDVNKAIYQLRTPNPNITWEVLNSFNIGVEGKLIKDKLGFEIDYFYQRRSNILTQRNATVPAYTGLILPDENLGKVQNAGFEALISHKNDLGKFHYEVIGTVSYSHNKVLFKDEPSNLPDYQRETGKQIGSNLFYEAIGIYRDQASVDKTPHIDGARAGDVIFRDVNGDGKIDDLDRVRVDQTESPEWIPALTLSGKYKNVDFTILFQGGFNGRQYLRTESGLIGNFPMRFVEDRWTKDNPDASWPRAYDRDREYWVNRQNTFWYWNTNYVRLKTVMIGYTIPASFRKRIGLQDVRIYVSGQNLLTFDKVKVFDPELPWGSGQFYPQTKIYNVGINITF
ncbi:TonB-dependent receptor [Chitinophaga pendula]|uniref:SusC/RagA family TonB-linked outer membrane protein n=1 Tax=Chitinophaga pendula TaxID=2849666 RepID=UPI001CED6FA9|nr:TonB-dependent receptor [Chitinophaga pendula]UCJ06612.1 TonB-dependent receptor [Chitinophaga pendula]